MAETETRNHVLNLTDAAQAMARKFLAEEADPSDKVLRVGVSSGGCSGFSYNVAIDTRKDDDLVQSYEGFDAVIDPISVQFLKNSTLDYVDDIGHAGFKFENPQASGTCGCGTSFTVE